MEYQLLCPASRFIFQILKCNLTSFTHFLQITLTNWTEYLCDFLEMEDRVGLSSHVTTIKRGHYGLLDINVKLGILHELVSEALTTYAIREKLDDCMKQQQALAATRREELRKKKEEQHLKKEEADNKEMDQRHILENGKVNSHNYVSQQGTEKVPSSKKNHISENGYANPYLYSIRIS